MVGSCLNSGGRKSSRLSAFELLVDIENDVGSIEITSGASVVSVVGTAMGRVFMKFSMVVFSGSEGFVRVLVSKIL